VRAFDARPEVGEQVESMGADFLKIDVGSSRSERDGYAKEMSATSTRPAAAVRAQAPTSTSSSRPRSSPASRHRG
jgi:NAD(P) transhydrogenase subunit alpha